MRAAAGNVGRLTLTLRQGLPSSHGRTRHPGRRCAGEPRRRHGQDAPPLRRDRTAAPVRTNRGRLPPVYRGGRRAPAAHPLLPGARVRPERHRGGDRTPGCRRHRRRPSRPPAPAARAAAGANRSAAPPRGRGRASDGGPPDGDRPDTRGAPRGLRRLQPGRARGGGRDPMGRHGRLQGVDASHGPLHEGRLGPHQGGGPGRDERIRRRSRGGPAGRLDRGDGRRGGSPPADRRSLLPLLVRDAVGPRRDVRR